ncbi:hypothetical protein A2U01_0035847, partial [Trifolium medium]|nr:hypothetical protein [Trifolium medium]
MVPPAPNVDLYKPRKRKIIVKTSEEEDQKEEVVKEAGKKKVEKKRKAEDNFDTKSDDRTLAQRTKQRTSKETFKKHLKNFSKGKSFETIIDESSEAQNVTGITIPLTTVLPESNPINISSSTSPDTVELDKEAGELIKEGIAKFGETPNPEAI